MKTTMRALLILVVLVCVTRSENTDHSTTETEISILKQEMEMVNQRLHRIEQQQGMGKCFFFCFFFNRSVTYFYFLADTLSFSVGPLAPLFWISGDVSF